MKRMSKKLFSLLLTVVMVATMLPYGAIVANAEDSNQVYGNVTIDPIIYTHGQSVYTHGEWENIGQLDYMMYGTKIADGSFDGECKTAVSSLKSIASVDVLETDGDAISVVGGVLTGDLGNNYAGVTTSTSSNATLKFVFTDGTYELHRLPVMTNPVAEHTLVSTFNWSSGVGVLSFETHRRVVACEVLARGSYGQVATSDTTIGSSVDNANASATDFKNNNFVSMYHPHSETYDSWESNKKICIDSMTDEMAVGDTAFDKVTGFSYTALYNKKSREFTRVFSPVATYYIDLSSNNNYGVDLVGDNYSINMLIGSLFFNSKSNYMLNGEPRTEEEYSSESVSVVSGASTANVSVASNKTLYTNKRRDYSEVNPDDSQTQTNAVISGKAKVGTSNLKYVLELGSGVSGGGISTSANITTNINLVVSDKTTTRNKYNDYITKLANGTIKKSCYTAESWADFDEAMLDAEQYLNDNTDSTSTQSYINNMQNKFNALAYSEKANHSFTNYVNDNNATCTTDETKTATCDYGCGLKDVQSIPSTSLGHNYVQTVVPPTCTAQGYTRHQCSRCTSVYQTDYQTALGHTPAGAVPENVVLSTCKTKGSFDSVIYCSVCHAELSRTTLEQDMLPHTPADAVRENNIDPTSTTDGSYESVVYCADCHYEISRTSVVVPSSLSQHSGHSLTTTKQNIIPATCTTTGSYDLVTYCSTCNPSLALHTEHVVLPMINHTAKPAQIEDKVDATCTADGHYNSRVRCEFCNTVLVSNEVVIPKKNHTYTSYVYNNDATCSSNGTETAYCDICHVATETKEKIGSLNPIKHNYGASIQNGDGTHTKTCSYNPAHTVTEACNYSNPGAPITPATCKEKGSEIRACTVCGSYKVVEIPVNPTAHNYSEFIIDREATCSTEGSKSKHCQNAGCTSRSEITSIPVNPTAHNYGDFVEDVPATCTTDGTKSKHCQNAGCTSTIEQTAISATGHSYSAQVTVATCTEKGYTTYTCNNCDSTYVGDYVGALGHSFTNYVSDNNATSTKDGTKTAKCQRCPVKNTITDTGSAQKVANQEASKPTTSNTGVSTSDVAGAYGVDNATANKIIYVINQYNISKDTALITNSAVTKRKNDGDFNGSTFSMLRAQATKRTNKSIKITWTKVKGADGYIIYANKCGKNNTLKKVKTVKKSATSYEYKKCKKGTYYKFFVVAYKNINGTKVTLAASKTIHATTKGGKNGVAKAVKINKVGKVKNAKKITLKAKKTAVIKAVEVKEDKPIKKHRAIAYESTNKKVAKVDKKGKITAVKKGKCKIYVYAQNGKYKTIDVTVK